MLTVQELAEGLTRLWQSRSRQAGAAPLELRADFASGYSNAILDLGRRLGITWISEEKWQVDAPARPSGSVEPAALGAAVTELREGVRQDEQEDRGLDPEAQAPGYFLGYKRAVLDITQAFGV